MPSRTRSNRPQTILFFFFFLFFLFFLLSLARANTTSVSLRKRRAMCNPQDLTRAKIPISCSPDPRANKGYLRQWNCVSAVRVHVVHRNATHVCSCPYGTHARASLPVSSNLLFFARFPEIILSSELIFSFFSFPPISSTDDSVEFFDYILIFKIFVTVSITDGFSHLIREPSKVSIITREESISLRHY